VEGRECDGHLRSPRGRKHCQQKGKERSSRQCKSANGGQLATRKIGGENAGQETIVKRKRVQGRGGRFQSPRARNGRGKCGRPDNVGG